MLTSLLLTFGAGAAIPLGGFIASFERIRPRWLERELRHFIIALGGGILLGAVAVVLVPEGQALLDDSLWVMLALLSGGLVFFAIERLLGLRRRAAPQLMGMLLDFVPEALALGALVALESPTVPLLALLIALQNLPEGFNAYRELIPLSGQNPVKTLRFMARLTLIGPVAGLCGFLFLGALPALLGFVMLFASGGILYLIFQDIAPQARLKKHWAPPLGAVVGFCIALFGHLIQGGSHP
nr:divalent cation transporter [Motiliproteus sp. SC1-56]